MIWTSRCRVSFRKILFVKPSFLVRPSCITSFFGGGAGGVKGMQGIPLFSPPPPPQLIHYFPHMFVLFSSLQKFWLIILILLLLLTLMLFLPSF